MNAQVFVSSPRTEKGGDCMTYDLTEDHAEIKKQIKVWELKIDTIVSSLQEQKKGHYDCTSELEAISHEMMAINM